MQGAQGGTEWGFPALPAQPEPGMASRGSECSAVHNPGAGINRELPAHFQSLNLDRGESAGVCDSSRLGGTGLGPPVPCVLEGEEGDTLLAPEVKPWGLAPDRQSAQINKGSSEPLWAPQICNRRGEGPKLRSDLSRSRVSPFRRRWGVCGASCPGHGSGSAPGRPGLALTQPPGGVRGVWQLPCPPGGVSEPCDTRSRSVLRSLSSREGQSGRAGVCPLGPAVPAGT